MTSMLDRIAGAPISWGVCEVPGWGHQMSPDRVLGEMAEVGLRATELGPAGYLPSEPEALSDLLARYDLEMIGGFVPAVLYRPDLLDDQIDFVERAADTLAGAGANIVVLGADAAHTGADGGYEEHIEMDGEEWEHFAVGLDRVIDVCAERGLEVTVHPHWGMAIERAHHVERLLEISSVGICVDSGHLGLADADPVEITELAGERVRHVHLKDVDGSLAARVRAGELTYHDAARRGLYRPLGEGDLDIAGVIGHLERNGYDGWYVLEQDYVLPAEPAPGSGPVEAARLSHAYLEGLMIGSEDRLGDGLGRRVIGKSMTDGPE